MEKKGRGSSHECRVCDAGLSDDRCIMKGVVRSMYCAVCGDIYIGETGRPVQVRFAVYYRDANTMACLKKS